jgi:hypothetical protein
MERRRQAAQHLVGVLLVAPEVTLELDRHVRAPEQTRDPIDQAAHAMAAGRQRLASHDRNQAAGVAGELVERERAFALGRSELHPRQQPAEVLIALPGVDQDRQAPPAFARLRCSSFGGLRPFIRCGHGQFASDDGLDAGGTGGLMEARRAVHAVAIHERERGISQRRRALDERLGQRSRLEEAERGGGVELGVHQSTTASMNHRPLSRSSKMR